MGKLEYLDALKRAMLGLAPELQAKTLAWYEQRFVDGLAAGRLEAEIAHELDDPKKVALTLRASPHMDAFAAQKNPANLVRVLVSSLGLLIFNLFMVTPAAVFGSLLAALYASAFVLYVSGIAITASGLAGANELVLDGPLRHVVDGETRGGVRTRVSIGEDGIEVSEDTAPGAAPDAGRDTDEGSNSRVVRGAERMAENGIRFSTVLDDESRATQTVLGLASVLG